MLRSAVARSAAWPLWRPSTCLRRGMCTEQPVDSSWKTWFEKRKHNVVQLLLSGSLMCAYGHSVNLRNRADDMENELVERLRASAMARRATLQRAPELAREMGLSKAAEAKFRAALHELDAQYEADPKSAGALLAQAKPVPVTSGAATPATLPAAAGGGAAKGAGAVW